MSQVQEWRTVGVIERGSGHAIVQQKWTKRVSGGQARLVPTQDHRTVPLGKATS